MAKRKPNAAKAKDAPEVEQEIVKTIEQPEVIQPVEEVVETIEEPKVEQPVVEVVEEPIVEEKPEVKVEKTPTTSKPEVTAPVTIEDVYAKYKDNAKVGMLVEAIMHYLSVIFGSRGNDGKTVASQNYNFYKLLLNVLSEKDYGTFKVKFDAINEMFRVGKDDKFSPISLSRFDHYWSYGGDSRMKYLILVEFISSMANPIDRAKAKKRFKIENITKSVPHDAVENLVRYYGL